MTRECDTNEWEVNARNSDALCFDLDEEKRNTETCKDCPYNTKELEGLNTKLKSA